MMSLTRHENKMQREYRTDNPNEWYGESVNQRRSLVKREEGYRYRISQANRDAALMRHL